MKKDIETIISQEHEKETKYVLAFLSKLSEEEKWEMLSFLRGVEFGKQLKEKAASILF